MNRYTIIASSVLLVLAASCAKVSPVLPQDQEITFAVANVAQATKATAFDTEKTFGTFAYWTPTDWATDGTTNLFMNNEEIANDGSVWASVSPRYWPKSGLISFASYAPYCKNGNENGFTAAPAYSYDHQFTFADYTIVPEANVDLMYADDANNKDCTNTTNTDGKTVVSGENDEVNDFTGVPTLFKHALTQVRFNFQRKPFDNPSLDEDESWIEVTSVRLSGLYNKNTFTDNTWDRAQATGEATYTLYEGEEGLKIAKTDENPTLVGNPMILLPQILTTTGEDATVVGPQTLEVTYNICIKFDSNPVVQRQEGLTASVLLGEADLKDWEMNKDITYLVTISPYTDTPITFDPAVADWTHLTGELSNE